MPCRANNTYNRKLLDRLMLLNNSQLMTLITVRRIPRIQGRGVHFADKSIRKRRRKIERHTGRMSLVLRTPYTICRQRMIAVRLQFARNSDRQPELDQHRVYMLRGKKHHARVYVQHFAG